MLSVKGMTCPMCSAKVEHALTTVPGVKSALVDLKSGQAKVVVDERVKPAQLVDAAEGRLQCRNLKAKSNEVGGGFLLPLSARLAFQEMSNATPSINC
jgi:copper chaperone CopZ